MEVVVKKWGNSASIRIPSVLMHELHLEINSILDMRHEKGLIVMEPVKNHREEDELNCLLNAIHLENIHTEVSFGVPVGREAL